MFCTFYHELLLLFPNQIWKVKGEKGTLSCFLPYQIIILRYSFVSRFSGPKTRQSSKTDTGWKICLKEERSRNKWVSQNFKFLFLSAIMSKNSLKCNNSLRIFFTNVNFSGQKNPKNFKQWLQKNETLFWTSAKMFSSKKSDVWMLRNRALKNWTKK